MGELEGVVEVLGGPKVLGRKIGTPTDLIGSLRRGLPYGAFEAVIRGFGLNREEASTALLIPPRTLDRRKLLKRFPEDESDRLYRLARLLVHGRQVLGDGDKVAGWLRKPNRALGSQTPLSLLDTDAGVRQVEDVLVRIEHGVFS